MAEDPVVNLLREHFKKVHECLQDKRNFDILTRFSFRSTSDKAIDDTDFDTDNDYINPEFELSQRIPGKFLTMSPESIPDTSFEPIDSEEFQAETDFEECSIENKSVTEASSSLFNSTLDDNEPHDDSAEQFQLVPYNKISRKSLLERPETPMLEMYDSEDENEYYDTTPRKMEGSQKFILYTEQLQAGDLKVDKSEILEILPKRDEPKPILNILSSEQSDSDFHKELEMYKRDIKLEKTIKSLSYNDKNVHNHTTSKIHRPSFSYDQCLKKVKDGYKAEMIEKPHDLKINNSFGLDVPKNEVPEYLEHYFEETNTNVYQRVSRYEQDDEQQSNYKNPHPESSVDNEIQVLIKEKILGNPLLDDESVKLTEENYVNLNHLEIQKEMMKRIEDMYKPGDGK